MTALDVLRQIKKARGATNEKVIEWGSADFINGIGVENLSRRDLRNHLEARDLEPKGTRLELIERLRNSIADEELNKFAVVDALDTEFIIQKEIEERGSVYVIGSNTKGQLGLGDLELRRNWTPIKSLRGVNVNYVVAGADMVYAVTDEHDVYVWGGGGSGRSGIDTTIKGVGENIENNYLEPEKVKDLLGEEIVKVTIGSSHCIAVGKGGDCFVWGDGDAGQLGLGSLGHHPLVAINNSFPAISGASAGSNHSVVLTKASEQLYIWGHASNGRLGLGELERVGAKDSERFYYPIPQVLATLERIKQVSCGADHCLAIGAAGVWTWGSGAGGRLGLGDNKDRKEPVLVPRLKRRCVSQVSAGHWHSMAVVIHPPMIGGGWIYTWGSGYHGQLGQGPRTVSMTAEVVDHFVKFHILISRIFAGSHHCCALTREGEMYSWGSNKYNCLGRQLDERDVEYTGTPGHVSGFGVLVNRIGRGFPRHVACGQEFTVVTTYPYEGPDLQVATKLMEEAKIRDEEALLAKQGQENFNEETMG